MSYTFLALNEFTVIAGPLLAAAEAGLGGLNKLAQPWRPPEWSQPAMTMLTVPATSAPTESSSQADGNNKQGEAEQYLIFDAVFKVDHSRELRRTEHPIQASASAPVSSITDHAFRLPARVTLEIGMSDAMQSYDPQAWNGNRSKSVACYQTLVDLQKQRRLLTLTTRLDTYKNMLLESIAPCDTVRTRNGLRATITLSEIFLADATGVSSRLLTDDSTDVQSARPQTTDSTDKGVQQTAPPSAALASQNQVPANQRTTSSVPGSGVWSSLSFSRLKGLWA